MCSLDFVIYALQSSIQDLMVVLRHLIGTPYRAALLNQLDKVFNERVLLGSGVGSQESLRSVTLSASSLHVTGSGS
jgi:transformation/transcription domain-associated protein